VADAQGPVAADGDHGSDALVITELDGFVGHAGVGQLGWILF
jgi:hypothetical protein